MGLAELAKNAFDPRTRLAPEKLKDARPVRNPAVQTTRAEDGTVVLEAPLAGQGNGFWGVVAKWMKAPNTKKFELEPVGAFCWELFDGSTTVETISRKLRERYKMNRVEADASLSAFLQMLSRRRLITLMVGRDK